ncbi:hypothetical protein M9Y10_038030 [Tritrichomonas musculus]|uniref:Protein kinase domain-containing protein n=1 Tax=Tritrichomonas musculus TaxID=1915356 RepID=A0ABR2K794_9EUKA
MSDLINQECLYILKEYNNIVCKQSIDKSINFEKWMKNNLMFNSFRRIIDESKLITHISDIDGLIDLISLIFKKDTNLNTNEMIFNDLKDFLFKLSIREYIQKINELYIKLNLLKINIAQNDQLNPKDNNEITKETLTFISDLFERIDQIINILFSFKKFNFFLSNISSTIIDIYINSTNVKIKSIINSSIINQCLFDDQGNLILVLLPRSTQEPKKANNIDQICNLYSILIKEYCRNIANSVKKETTKSIQSNIYNYFLEKNTNFQSKFDLIREKAKKSSANELFSLLNTFFKDNLSEKSPFVGFDNLVEWFKKEEYLYIKKIFSQSFREIIDSYKDHTNFSFLIQPSYQFNNIISSNKSFCDIISSTKFLYGRIDLIFEQIFKETKNYYYFNFFIHITVQNFIKQDCFAEKYQELPKDNGYWDNDFHDIKDLPNLFNFKTLSSLSNDKDLHFFIQKRYNSEENLNLISNEIKILSSNYSKFIAQLRANIGSFKIFIPYFPLKSLNLIFGGEKSDLQKKRVKLSAIDKIVIILEIATALKDLHSNNEYHGNLCSQFIYLTSTKDAYIGAIYYDENYDNEATRPIGPFYYRAPEFISKEASERDEKYIKQNQLLDVFSYGVLMHEIVTEKTPESRFGNRPRKERLEILKNEKEKSKNTSNFIDYCDFLFKEGGGNEVFEDNYKDEEGNSFQGMKEIIEKCMKTETTERYSSFKELIGCIEALPIYTNNEEEIEFRLKHAIDAREYQCTISDLVECYLFGNEDSFNDILSICFLYNKHVENNKNIIKILFETFKIEANCLSLDVEARMNLIAKQYYSAKNRNVQSVVDEEDYLLKLSREANLDEEEGREIVIPVCSLGSFIENNGNIIEEGYSLTFLYFIAKDLSLIHSNNLYHGEVRADHIGLYYNHETRTLIPSVILYYSYYKNNQNSMNDMNSKKRIPSKIYSSEELLSKEQRKDIKNFIKIAEKLRISDEILSKIQKSEAMIDIVYHLSLLSDIMKTFIKNHILFQKSTYQILFPSLTTKYKDLKNFFYFIKNNDLIMDNFTDDFEQICNLIISFLDLALENPSFTFNKISQLIEMRKKEKIDQNQLLESIRKKCSLFYESCLLRIKIDDNINFKDDKHSPSIKINNSYNIITISTIEK